MFFIFTWLFSFMLLYSFTKDFIISFLYGSLYPFFLFRCFFDLDLSLLNICNLSCLYEQILKPESLAHGVLAAASSPLSSLSVYSHGGGILEKDMLTPPSLGSFLLHAVVGIST